MMLSRAEDCNTSVSIEARIARSVEMTGSIWDEQLMFEIWTWKVRSTWGYSNWRKYEKQSFGLVVELQWSVSYHFLLIIPRPHSSIRQLLIPNSWRKEVHRPMSLWVKYCEQVIMIALEHPLGRCIAGIKADSPSISVCLFRYLRLRLHRFFRNESSLIWRP